MCRLVAYSGEPIYLETQLSDPPRSLISQSRAARESLSSVNGDGCGIGWYGDREHPGIYRSIHPAWSDPNLVSLCQQVRSRLFVGHIRAATSGEVATANCHPFSAGRHVFLHNGEIGGYERLRHRIEMLIPETVYPLRKGTSDSEAIFLTALGRGLDADPVAAISASLSTIAGMMKELHLGLALHFAAVHGDGRTLRAFRWSSDGIAPTLYWREVGSGVVVASEPYDEAHAAWRAVPENSVVTVGQDGTVDIADFLPRARVAQTITA